MESHANMPPDDPLFFEWLPKGPPSVAQVLKLMMASGLRVGEVLRLNGQSVDVRARTVRLPSRKTATMPTRVVTVSPTLARELRRDRAAKRRARRLR